MQPVRTAEEKAAQRRAKRDRRKSNADNARLLSLQPFKSHNRYSGIRAVVCEQTRFRYRRVDAPRDMAELRAVTDPAPKKEDGSAHVKRLWRRRSWEVLTERSLGQG